MRNVSELPASEDGVRIFVERLWPRGLSKESARIDIWLSDIAPSTELRKWYNHIPEIWPEFQKRYQSELRENDNVVQGLKKKIDTTDISLIFAAKDVARNSAVVLKSYLEKRVFSLKNKFFVSSPLPHNRMLLCVVYMS